MMYSSEQERLQISDLMVKVKTLKLEKETIEI